MMLGGIILITINYGRAFYRTMALHWPSAGLWLIIQAWIMVWLMSTTHFLCHITLPLLPNILPHFPWLYLNFPRYKFFMVVSFVVLALLLCKLGELAWSIVECIKQSLKRWNGSAEFTRVDKPIKSPPFKYNSIALGDRLIIIYILHDCLWIPSDLDCQLSVKQTVRLTIHSYVLSILHIFSWIIAFRWSAFCFEVWSMSITSYMISVIVMQMTHGQYLLTVLHPATATASICVPTSKVSHFFCTARCIYCSSSEEVKCQWGFMWYSGVFLTMQKKPSMLTCTFKPVICTAALPKYIHLIKQWHIRSCMFWTTLAFGLWEWATWSWHAHLAAWWILQWAPHAIPW